MSIEIRPATPADAEAIAAVRTASRERSLPELVDAHDRDAGFWTERWRRYIERGSAAQHARGDGWAFVAEADDGPVGFAAYHHTARHGCDAELESIYVLREAQGRGVGTALLWRIGERLVGEGSRSLCVGYDPRNPYKRFYLKHGAVEINPHWAAWRDLGAFSHPPASR
ncbi:MAG TPA: GNAT family N-acetyltransferase [Gemmatimonadales bacterium]|nr:GNAT family N-acetyltransferase [Gemmatimonadales bacterium]